MTDWQPIATAPKDGTPIQIAVAGSGLTTGVHWVKRRVLSAYFNAQGNSWVVEGQWAKNVPAKITHWMPLPDPPEAKTPTRKPPDPAP